MTYLTNCEDIRRRTGLGDNVADEWILPALREVQELTLRELVGDALLLRLKTSVEQGEAEGVYVEAVAALQPWLAYMVAAALAVPLTVRTSNIGVHVNADEKVSGAGYDTAVRMRDYWTGRADACLVAFEKWLLAEDVAELRACGCGTMRAHLESAASGGLWLGGLRGKRLVRG